MVVLVGGDGDGDESLGVVRNDNHAKWECPVVSVNDQGLSVIAESMRYTARTYSISSRWRVKGNEEKGSPVHRLIYAPLVAIFETSGRKDFSFNPETWRVSMEANFDSSSHDFTRLWWWFGGSVWC